MLRSIVSSTVAYCTMLACSVFLFSPTRSLAQDTGSIAVLGITSLEGDDAVAHDVTMAMRRAVGLLRGFHLNAREISLGQVELAQGCELSEAACASRIMLGLQTERMMTGLLRRLASGGFELDARYFDRRPGHAPRSERLRIGANPEFDTLREPVAALVMRLVGGQESAPQGSQAVGAQPAGALSTPSTLNVVRRGALDIRLPGHGGAFVSVDGNAAGRLDVNGGAHVDDLSVGNHEVVVRNGDHVTHRGVANIEADTLAIFTPSPVAESAAPSRAATPTGGATWRQPVAYTLLGVSALAVLGVIWGAVHNMDLSNNAEYDAYRRVPHESADPCVAASLPSSLNMNVQSLCRDADTFYALQFVFGGVALLAAGGAAAILLTADERQTPTQAQVRFVPMVGEQRFGLRVAGQF